MPIPLGIVAVAGAGGGAGGGGSFDLLQTTLLSTTTASVTFSNLNTYSAYKHLQLRMVLRKDGTFTTTGMSVNVNGDTNASYAFHRLRGLGGSVGSAGNTSQFAMLENNLTGGGATANAYAAVIIDLLDFANTAKNPVFRVFSGATTGTTSLDRVELISGLYPTAGAVTSLTLGNSGVGGNFVSGSRLSLYGIK
jgi:hypothetical protein